MRRVFFIFAVVAFMMPAPSLAAGLTAAQQGAIVALLEAFGVDSATLARVEHALGGAGTADPPVATSATTTPASAHVPVVGSVYKTSNLGFDYSYNAPLFPPTNFGFGLVGVSGGRAFTTNPRINQEYNWAKFGAGAPPTLYMNLNAPYGSSVAGHVSSPENCPSTTTNSAGDPSACAGYNYGYNAAAAALAYAKSAGVSSSIWWLDIEEANSWAPDPSVNDQVIQGAIDYLNSQGIRAGIYSMGYMWKAIAGASFVPAQMVNGQNISTPTWIPIGISDLIGAADYCAVGSSFIASSPVWLVQYVASPTAVDQNYAC